MYKGRYRNSGVKCPHYKGQNNGMIICDGAEGSSSSMQTFSSASGRKEFQVRYCGFGMKGITFSGDFRRCPIFRMLEAGGTADEE